MDVGCGRGALGDGAALVVEAGEEQGRGHAFLAAEVVVDRAHALAAADAKVFDGGGFDAAGVEAAQRMLEHRAPARATRAGAGLFQHGIKGSRSTGTTH